MPDALVPDGTTVDIPGGSLACGRCGCIVYWGEISTGSARLTGDAFDVTTQNGPRVAAEAITTAGRTVLLVHACPELEAAHAD